MRMKWYRLLSVRPEGLWWLNKDGYMQVNPRADVIPPGFRGSFRFLPLHAVAYVKDKTDDPSKG